MLKWWKRRKAQTEAKRDYGNMVALYAEAVSYTHLTLPTSDLV